MFFSAKVRKAVFSWPADHRPHYIFKRTCWGHVRLNDCRSVQMRITTLSQSCCFEKKTKHCWDVSADTPYLMNHPISHVQKTLIRTHSRKTLDLHWWNFFLSQDVCKQQPSLPIFIKPQCEKHCRMSVVWKTRFSCCYIFEIPQDLNFICWRALKENRHLAHLGINYDYKEYNNIQYLPHFWAVFIHALDMSWHIFTNIAYITLCWSSMILQCTIMQRQISLK